MSETRVTIEAVMEAATEGEVRMIDRDQLREALEGLTARWRYDNLDSIDDSRKLRAVMEAARLVVEGREVWWCEEHESSGNKTACHASYAGIMNPFPCRMVRMILIDGNTE